MITNFLVQGTIGSNVVDLVVFSSPDLFETFSTGFWVGCGFLGFALLIKIVRMIKGGYTSGIGDMR